MRRNGLAGLFIVAVSRLALLVEPWRGAGLAFGQGRFLSLGDAKGENGVLAACHLRTISVASSLFDCRPKPFVV